MGQELLESNLQFTCTARLASLKQKKKNFIVQLLKNTVHIGDIIDQQNH